MHILNHDDWEATIDGKRSENAKIYRKAGKTIVSHLLTVMIWFLLNLAN